MKPSKVLFPLALLALAASVPAAAPITITQKGLQFSSSELSVGKGQVVTFVNDDRTAHNITVKGEAPADAEAFEREEGKFEKYFSEKPGRGS